jgi:A/G-specific adenine glycosylase
VVSEVLLQRTRAEVVASFFPSFVRQFPSWRVLSRASERDLQEFLRPLGLWRQRASSLRRLAAAIAKRNGRFPTERSEIESLPNVGQYIANAIELFSHDQRKPLLDSGMARVLERFFGPRRLADIRFDPDLQSIAHRVVAGSASKETNWAILDLAAMICKKRPSCPSCPLQKRCRFANNSCHPENRT